jgi:hypothetical protein
VGAECVQGIARNVVNYFNVSGVGLNNVSRLNLVNGNLFPMRGVGALAVRILTS